MSEIRTSILAAAYSRGIVPAVTRNPFDYFGKQMLRAALEEHGRVDTDKDVPAEARKIDLCFMPIASPAPLPEDLGLLGRMTTDPGTFEFFHHTPGVDAIGGCLIKHGEFRQFLAGRKTPPPTPTQWVISSGRPKSGIAGYWLRPMSSRPAGVYEGPPSLWTHLVVVSELPVVRNTLLLRLLGAGRTQEHAITELKALPANAPERLLALPILTRLRLDIPEDEAQQTADEKEFLKMTQDIVDAWRQAAIQEGDAQGFERGTETGSADALVDLYEVRFGTIPEDVRAIIEGTRNRAALRAWHKLAASCSAAEIINAIRARRAA